MSSGRAKLLLSREGETRARLAGRLALPARLKRRKIPLLFEEKPLKTVCSKLKPRFFRFSSIFKIYARRISAN
jgi:hypothetical protein